jgi:hypothetical protein
MVEGQVRRDGPSLRLEHDGCLPRSDPPQQLELLVGERAAGRVVPELETLTMDLADAVRQLKPDVARQGVRPEGGGVDVEDGSPFGGDSGVPPQPRELVSA